MNATVINTIWAVVLLICLNVRSFQRQSFNRHKRYGLIANNAFNVKVIDGEEKVVSMSADDTILNELERLGYDAPYSCRTGLCTECAAKVNNINAVKLDAAVFDPETTAKGYILTCSSRVKGDDLVLILNQHAEMYESQYGNFRKDHEESQAKIVNNKGIMGGFKSALNLNTEA
jgi:ferredoxin